MQKRDVIIAALQCQSPPYVPWSWGTTHAAGERLKAYLQRDELHTFFDNHIWMCGPQHPAGERLDARLVRDCYGVVYTHAEEQDLGVVVQVPLQEPEDLAHYQFPDPRDPSWYADLGKWRHDLSDHFTMYLLGGALYECAWALRGMEDLLMDMVERPEFVEALLDAITENRLIQVEQAIAMDFDGVFFGDDYGMQTGLMMGAAHWRHFIKPRLARLIAPLRAAGKYAYLHSCGKVDGILDDLVEIGLHIFNPFQPEVMDVFALLPRYHGRLAFHGGMGVQSVLPHGTTAEVTEMTRRLLRAGESGGFIFSPSHDATPDIPPENLVAMMRVLTDQAGYRSLKSSSRL